MVEFRTRLIADVVTGQLDVREAALDLPEASEEEFADLDTTSELDDDVELDSELTGSAADV